MPRSGPIILYVGSDAPHAAPVGERLRAEGANVHVVADVYLALARWGKRAIQPAAVIVCVDYLAPPDFEFFKIAARDHARTPVYVCAHPLATGKLELAIQSHARGIVTPEDVQELLCELSSDAPDTETKPQGGEATGGLDSQNEPDYAEPAEAAVPPKSEPDYDDGSFTDEDAAEPAGEIRVPWKSYGDRPVRKPPGWLSAAQPPAQTPSETPFDGPLLSREELEALMRDDFRTMDRE